MEKLLSRNHVDFVTTPITSPPTKNLAVKRSLKVSKTPMKMKTSCTIDCSEDKKDILDFLCSDEETRNDSNQSENEYLIDLIDFESPPLIDLSEAEEDVSNVSFLNARNIEQSKALTEFLKEFNDNVDDEREHSEESCAMEETSELSHSEESSATTNSTTSTTYIPLHESPAEPDCAAQQNACAEICSSTTLPSNIQNHHSVDSSIDENYVQDIVPSVDCSIDNCLLYLDLNSSRPCATDLEESRGVFVKKASSPERLNISIINCAISSNKSHRDKEDLSQEKISFNRVSDLNLSSASFSASVDEQDSLQESLHFEPNCDSLTKKESSCHCSHLKNDGAKKSLVKDKSPEKSFDKTENSSSVEIVNDDNNNNCQSVVNQNKEDIKEKCVFSSWSQLTEPKYSEKLDFLSKNTSQSVNPPKWFSSSNNELNSDCFESSQRLKRLEERFKGFAYTKKLLGSSKLFSKSEEILNKYDLNRDFEPKNCQPKSLTCSPIPFAVPAECLQKSGSPKHEKHEKRSTANNVRDKSGDDLPSLSFSATKKSSSSSASNICIDETKSQLLLDAIKLEKLQKEDCKLGDISRVNSTTPESSSAESDEICKIFRDNEARNALNEPNEVESVDYNFVGLTQDTSSSVGSIVCNNLYDDLIFSNCEFDVRTLKSYLSEYGLDDCGDCYDELDQEKDNSDEEKSDESDFYCDCLIEEVVPLYNPLLSIMRETSGPLRGLLKKPNRPPPARKNRVVFDETRNEFFEADYIILIREDCPYDEEDEEPCSCGDHELVRICCDEGCNCGYNAADPRTPPSPKFAPPIEFVDQATLSPPEGYKDGGLLDNALSGALGNLNNHVFGAQHIQQLQVIQRLQQQRAAMLAARAASANANNTYNATNQQANASQPPQVAAVDPQQQIANAQTVCTECAECAECAKQLNDEGECDSQCSEDALPTEVPHQPHHPQLDAHVLQLIPIQKSSPERRTSQKEIIAGEERPKFLTIKQIQDGQEVNDKVNTDDKEQNDAPNQTYVVETITMTTVTERRVIRKATDVDEMGNLIAATAPAAGQKTQFISTAAQDISKVLPIYTSSISVENMKNDLNATIIPKFNTSNGTAQAINGILKGGKLRNKNEQPVQCDESTTTTSDEETSSKRSVRFTEDNERQLCDGENQSEMSSSEKDQPVDYVSQTLKRNSSLFHNALRPNSAVRQLFPAKTQSPPLTHEALKAFDESKRPNLMIATATPTTNNVNHNTPLTHSNSDTDTIKRTIERNALRRSLIKYEPKKKTTLRDATSLEERIRILTCNIDEPSDSDLNGLVNELERRDSPAGEENPQQSKYSIEKSFSPSSSASSSSSASTGSTYRKITDLFNKDKRQDKILEAEENPIVIIPQDCRCPAGPDIGMGVQIQGAHTQIHQPPPPPRQTESKRQFLSTLAPLTACVAGQRDDFSYYMLAKPGDRISTASSQATDTYSIGDIDAVLQDDEVKKVAPDVIAGTPGQDSDELVTFAQQEAIRTDRIKKRYSSETSTSAPASGVNSDDDEQNDYGFNKRPSVRGIKPRFGSTNEILQQMQDQLSQPNQVPNQAPNNQTTVPQMQTIQSATLPRPSTNSGGVQVAAKQQFTAHHQHTASWSYYPEQAKKTPGVADAYSNYYHLPAHARHSYHGHEAIYQNCHTMTLQQQQTPPQLPQKMSPQPQAIQQAQQISQLNRFARSPTRRPESPPPLRNYHQTMVLIPYKPDSPYQTYGVQDPENIYHRQHNIVEYQQVTQQTIRVPIGYPLPGMQLHVVAGRGVPAATPHYATLPRQAMNAGQQPKYSFTVDKANMKFQERGVPEGAASVQQTQDSMMSPTCQDPNPAASAANNPSQPGTVYYAMNV